MSSAAALRPRREHRLPGLRALPAHDRPQNVEYGLRVRKVREGGARIAGQGGAARGAPRGLRRPQAGPALGRPAPAGRARSRDRQYSSCIAPRRAAWSPRPQAPTGVADRAEAVAAGARDDVRLRHARPGRGAHDERPHRRLQRGQIEQIGTPAEVYEHPAKSSSPGSSASSNVIERDGRRRHRQAGEDPGSSTTARSPSRGRTWRKASCATSSTSGPVTRYHVSLDKGGELQVLAQNLEESSAEVIGVEGRRVRLAWRPEQESVIVEREGYAA